MLLVRSRRRPGMTTESSPDGASLGAASLGSNLGDGVCAYTSARESDCWLASQGARRLPAASNTLEDCLRFCAGCPKCNFVSFSDREAECGWFAQCAPLTRDAVTRRLGFRTARLLAHESDRWRDARRTGAASMAQAVEEMGLRLQPADRDEPRMPLTPSTSRCTGEEYVAARRRQSSAACARPPRWPAAVPSVRLALEHGQREWVEVEVGSATIARQTAIYWVTPKVAHTTIARLLQRTAVPRATDVGWPRRRQSRTRLHGPQRRVGRSRCGVIAEQLGAAAGGHSSSPLCEIRWTISSPRLARCAGAWPPMGRACSGTAARMASPTPRRCCSTSG